MLKLCPYCSRVHAKTFDCGRKPVKGKRGTDADKFHGSYKWTQLSKRVRERDRHMCVYCWQQEHRITTQGIEVHHIVPIAEDYDARMDEDNLVSLCRRHHEQAEQGAISRQKLFELVHMGEDTPRG